MAIYSLQMSRKLAILADKTQGHASTIQTTPAPMFQLEIKKDGRLLKNYGLSLVDPVAVGFSSQ